jgi:nucleotide-binding universal stress UspA family protein
MKRISVRNKRLRLRCLKAIEARHSIMKTDVMEAGMFTTILVPTDGSPLSDKAVDAAIDLAKEMGSRLVGISVAQPLPYVALAEGAIASDLEQFEVQAREMAQAHVQKMAEAASAANVPCDTMTALSFSPYEEIINAANRFRCDLIFMASHGRSGLQRLFVGSETQKVLAHTSLPVLVYR